jgi:hypothetical protein
MSAMAPKAIGNRAVTRKRGTENSLENTLSDGCSGSM